MNTLAPRLLALFLAATGCVSPAPADGGSPSDAGQGESDGGGGEPDAGTDAGTPDAGPLLPPTTVPAFATEAVLFEDTMTQGTTVPPLVYRVEGDGGVVRAPPRTTLVGPVGLVHPAQLRRATLRATLRLLSGEVTLAFAHNGMTTTSGAPNPSPGLGLLLAPQEARVIELSTGTTLARIDVATPLDAWVDVAIAWEVAAGTARFELGGQAFLASGLTLPRGGFAVLARSPGDRVELGRLALTWQDARLVRLYDGYDRLYLGGGVLDRVLPAAQLPAGTAYSTVAVDPAGQRTLLLYGPAATFNPLDRTTITALALRTLATGAITSLSGLPPGCLPQQGGMGFDGIGLYATPPTQSLYWLDFGALDRGQPESFCTLARAAAGDFSTGNFAAPFVAWADAASALDGSLARLVRLDERWQGVTHLVSHPALAPFVAFTEVTIPQHSSDQVSHTGPAGFPTQLAVRDADRAFFEEWSYVDFWKPDGGSNLHTRNRGFNLFTGQLDWEGPEYSWRQDAAPYVDWANMVPSLTTPGVAIAPRFRFSPQVSGAGRVVLLSADRLQRVDGGFSVLGSLATTPANAADMLYPILY